MTTVDLRCFTHEPLDPVVRRALVRVARIDDVAVVAAMPDVHLAKAVCVGAVIGARTTLMPDAVGGDIGCGMAAVRLDCSAEAISEAKIAARLLTMLGQLIPTAKHRSASAALPDQLIEQRLSSPILESKKLRVGRLQFGTLGKGNHFVEFQRDDSNKLWLMLHSGSRGIGQAIREHHGGADGSLLSIPANSEHGRDYLADLAWALEYARASRRRMAEAAIAGLAELTGHSAVWQSFVDCHHNFVRRETHDGQALWVHRKGAISARSGEAGIIPGSMGSCSFHVSGRANSHSLCSSSHGAGRVMSRTEARRAISVRQLGVQMKNVWFDHRIANQLRDEAPSAYKDIGAVMRAQRDLTRIERRLTPVLVYKGN